MKKCFLGLLFLTGFAFASADAAAVTCETYGITPGQSCDAEALKNRTGQNIHVGCRHTNNCIFVNCSGACSCADSGICESMSDKNLWCNSSPAFHQGDTASGSVIGNCTSVTGEAISISGCMDGFYTLSDQDIWGGYVFGVPSCSPCPWYPDDIDETAGKKPSYATTGGDGIHYGMNSCKIKAGRTITDSTGTFEFTSECPYSY